MPSTEYKTNLYRDAAEAAGWYRANGTRGMVEEIIHDDHEQQYNSFQECCEDQDIEIDDPNDVDYLRTPFGYEITATLEVIPGICAGDYEDDEFMHAGETDVVWDGQETVVRAGQRVFLEDDGTEWLESELVKPGEPLPAIYVSPWEDAATVRAFLQEKFDETMAVVMADKQSGDTAPEVQMQIDNALDALAALAVAVRRANA